MIYKGKQKIWSEYQKEIPSDNWFYARSCIRQNFFPASEKYFLTICRDLLGKDIYECLHHFKMEAETNNCQYDIQVFFHGFTR